MEIENKYELVKELWSIQQRQFAIGKELYEHFNKYAVDNAEFQIGEKVEVWSDKEYVMDGIISGVFHGINYSWEGFVTKKYVEKPESYTEEIKNIRYKVKAIKKDGTISERNANGSSSYGSNPENAYNYIKKKSTKQD